MKARRTRISAYALIRQGGKVLLCRLSQEVPRWEGFWTLPGGGIEFGESPEQAMVREVEEETGLQVEPCSILGIDSIHDPGEDSEFHGIRIIYDVRVTRGELRAEMQGSTDACAWHDYPLDPALPLVDLAIAGCRLLPVWKG